MRFKPQIKKLDRVGDPIEGLSGLNLEVLTGHKTLIVGRNKKCQFFDHNNGNRNITLDKGSAVAGSQWTIRNVGAWDITKYLLIKNGAVMIDKIYAGTIKKYIYDGINWRMRAEGSGESGFLSNNLAWGGYAQATEGGLAIGRDTYALQNGIAIGNSTGVNANGVGVGKNVYATDYSTAIGAVTRAEKRFSVALGFTTKTRRHGEIANFIGGNENYNITTCGWTMVTNNNTPVEMRAGTIIGQRYDILENSCVAFKIMVTARDNISGDCAAYKFEGLIKRDGADNTVMSVCNKTVIHEDDATWDCDVTADDANEALKIEITGDASNKVQWSARLDGVETVFS